MWGDQVSHPYKTTGKITVLYSYVCSLYVDAVRSSPCLRQVHAWQWLMNLCRGIEGNVAKFGQKSLCGGRDSNSAARENKTHALPPGPAGSVIHFGATSWTQLRHERSCVMNAAKPVLRISVFNVQSYKNFVEFGIVYSCVRLPAIMGDFLLVIKATL